MSHPQNEHFNESAMEAANESRDWFDDLFNADYQREKADRALLSVSEVSRLSYLKQVDNIFKQLGGY